MFITHYSSITSIPDGSLLNDGMPSISLTPAIQVKQKTVKAYSRLFWAVPPHNSMERLCKFNQSVLRPWFITDIHTLFSERDPQFYYKDAQDIRDILEPEKKGGNIRWTLFRSWRKHTDRPNPHHIIPTSRGGTNHDRNLRNMDRIAHDDFHEVFVNLTPVEQLLHMSSLLGTHFTQEFLTGLLRITIQESPIYHYRPSVVQRKILKASA